MEPVTHVLTGLCLARSGFNRKTAYAAAAMAVAAELPDADMLWTVRGPVEQFQHHRGITHTFVGVPFEAALVVGAVWAWGRRAGNRAGNREQGVGSRAAAVGLNTRFPSGMTARKASASALVPVRWGWLYGGVVVALLSHLLLDYTNNYGIRPFFPFNTRWYAGSIVFIFDPLLFALLTVALVAPSLFGLVGSEVGARRVRFRGQGWAMAALLGMVSLWGLRAVEHGRAVQMAQAQSVVLPGEANATDTAPVYLTARRTLANPDPWSPFRWSAVTDFGPVYQMAEIETREGTVDADEVLTPKPQRDAATLAAEASPLGRAYIDWSPMPFVDEEALTDGGTWVTFRDPRFLGGWMAAQGRRTLVGAVRLDARGQVVEQSMDGKVEQGVGLRRWFEMRGSLHCAFAKCAKAPVEMTRLWRVAKNADSLRE